MAEMLPLICTHLSQAICVLYLLKPFGASAKVDQNLRFSLNIQSTLVISKSKGPSKIFRDIRTSTYQTCSTEEKQLEQPKFTNDYVI